MDLEGLCIVLKRLQQHLAHPGGDVLAALRAAAVQQEQQHAATGARDAPVQPQLDDTIELLAAALLAPPEELFADLSGAPKAPEGERWEET